MGDLAAIQSGISRTILGQPSAALMASIRGAGLDPEDRMNIHANTYRLTLRDSLAAVFPVIKKLVGSEFFAFATRQYVLDQPPASPVLIDYGATFADFLDDFEPAADLVYLADVAHLEWARHRAIHAADQAALDPARLANIDQDRFAGLSLQPRDGVVVLTSDYPVTTIWQSNQEGAAAAEINLDSGGDNVLVERTDMSVRFHPLSAGEAILLATLIDGDSVAVAADLALAGDPGLDLQAALGRFLTLGVFATFSFKEDVS